MSRVAQGGSESLTAVVRDGNGDLADCDDLALTIADPDGDELAGFPVEAPDIVRDSLGNYHFLWEVGGAQTLGVYDIDWSGTVDGLAIGGSDSIEVVLAGSIDPDPIPEFLAYATVDDIQIELPRIETDQRALDRIASALTGTTDRLIEELGFDFFKHPSSGTETWLVDTKHGGSVIHQHHGVVSVSLIRIRLSRTADWTELDADDFDLEAWATGDPNQITATREPFDHIRLNGSGTAGLSWPRGQRLVEITGVRGWPAIPRRAVDANVDWARQDIAADRTFPGGVISPNEAGVPMLPHRLPDSVTRLRQWALYRFACDT